MAVYWNADAVVFDAFHTLIAAPSMAYHIPIALRLQDHLPRVTPSLIENTVKPYYRDLNCGCDEFEIWSMILSDLGLSDPPSDLVYELMRMQAVGTIQYAKPRPQMREVLEELRGRGIATAICSNAGHAGRFVQELFDLPELADAYVVSCDIGCAKPEEKIFLAAAHALGIAPSNCVYVDDGVVYLEEAGRLGFMPIHAVIGEVAQYFPEPHEPAWPVIRSLPEVLDFVRPAN